MQEQIDLNILEYGAFKQRSYLKNVTALPTKSGNAQMQLATVPKVKGDFSGAMRILNIPIGHKIVQVEQAFDWVVYRTEYLVEGTTMNRIWFVSLNVMNLPSSTGARRRFSTMQEGTGKGFEDYMPTEFNKWGKMRVVDFVDLNAVKWVVVWFNGKAWKFLNDISTHRPVINTEPDESNISTDDIIEVFVQGSYYQYYVELKRWDYAGYFNFGNINERNFTSLTEWIELARKNANYEAFNIKTALVMTRAFKDCLKVENVSSGWIGNITTSAWETPITGWPAGDLPAGGQWYSGLGAAYEIMTSLNDNNNRGWLTGVSNTSFVAQVSHDLGITEGESIGILTAMATGGAIGESLFGPIGGAAGLVLGAAVAIWGAITSTLTKERYFFIDFTESPTDDYERTSAEEGNSTNADDSSPDNGKIMGCVGNIFHNLGGGAAGVYRIEDGVSVPYFNTVWTDIEVGNIIPISSDPESAYGAFAVMKNCVSSIVNYAERYTADLRMRTWYATAGYFYRRNIDNFFRAWALGNVRARFVKNIHNNATGGPSHTFSRHEFSRSLKQVLAAMDNAMNGYADADSTQIFYSYLDTIAKNIDDFLNDPTDGFKYWEDNISKMIDFMNDSGLFASEEINVATQMQSRIKDLINSMNRMLTYADSTRIYVDGDKTNNRIVYISTDTIRYLLNRIRGAIDVVSERWNTVRATAEQLQTIMIQKKSDYPILFLETLAHMLMVIAGKRGEFLYYSYPGTTDISPLNVNAAEYSNSTPQEIWRLANRIVLFTNNTVEFWDLTGDFENPISSAMNSNVYSMQVLPNSRARMGDTLYFWARPVELDTYSCFSIGKDGGIKNISYPQLDDYVNRNMRFVPSEVTASVINVENIPVIQWIINRRDMDILNFNTVTGNFHFTDTLQYLVAGLYWEHGSQEVGSLDKYKGVDCLIRTTNTNFEGKMHTINFLEYDIDLEDLLDETRDTPKDNYAIYDKRIHFRFDKVSKLPSGITREVALRPRQGDRNEVSKVLGIGMGYDIQTEIWWSGYLRWNRISYNTEKSR